jgi:ribosomal-protein-alanine N-acetyltransferase
MPTIRPATPRPASSDDLDALIHLAAATPEAPQWDRMTYERFLSPDNPNSQIFIAEAGTKLTGFAAAQIILDVCELQSIVVAGPARRSGVATKLLSTLIEWARKQSASRVQLEVRAGNSAAIAFYERAGLRRDGLRRAYYRHPDEDALLMSLPLPPQNPPRSAS